MQLSKTDYMAYLKHPAWAWYRKNAKKALPPVSADLQARFDAGHAFEVYAEAQFPDAVKLEWDGFAEYSTLPKRTQAALDDGADVLMQGRFEGESTTCIIDVLQRVSGNEFDLFEIKSSTKVKPEYVDDLAFQVTVLEDAGLTIRNVGVIHVNREYVRDGDIEPEKFATKPIDITRDVMARLASTREQTKKALLTVKLETCPDMSPRYAAPASLLDWLEVYAYVKPVTSDSIFMLARRTTKMIGALEDLGVTRIADIPDGFALSEKQGVQVAVTKSGKQAINPVPIQAFLEELEYPLYFLDYETFSSAVPAFDGVRPYQQVPFQYALYKMEEPGADLEFTEYLHEEATHPGPELLKSLKSGMGDRGSVLVWYQSFEKGCNDTLAAMVPEYADFLKDVNKRIVDLMVPFASGWFVDKDFFGSASIKKVLPVLVPELSYADLDIHEGQQAQREWTEAVLLKKGAAKKGLVMENLRVYCKQDVLAMVEILRKLEAL